MTNQNQTIERIYMTFKFEGEIIKYPLDAVFGQGDIFKEIIEGKTEGGTLEHLGKVYNMHDLKAVEVSFE